MLILCMDLRMCRLLSHDCNNVKVELMCVIYNPAKRSKVDPQNITGVYHCYSTMEERNGRVATTEDYNGSVLYCNGSEVLRLLNICIYIGC